MKSETVSKKTIMLNNETPIIKKIKMEDITINKPNGQLKNTIDPQNKKQDPKCKLYFRIELQFISSSEIPKSSQIKNPVSTNNKIQRLQDKLIEKLKKAPMISKIDSEKFINDLIEINPEFHSGNITIGSYESPEDKKMVYQTLNFEKK